MLCLAGAQEQLIADEQQRTSTDSSSQPGTSTRKKPCCKTCGQPMKGHPRGTCTTQPL